MATITPLRPNGVSLSPKLLVLEPKPTSQLQSPERQKLAAIADELLQNLVFQHYLETLENIGEVDYKPVPPKHSEQVIMRAQFKGRKKPLPYIFDEE